MLDANLPANVVIPVPGEDFAEDEDPIDDDDPELCADDPLPER